VLGRNLEALVSAAQEKRREWGDEFVSVEHLVLAFLDDQRFGAALFKEAGLDKAKASAA
jgi:ATP-dependent Clp protease ATP-binding subunit ClpB